MSSSRVYNAHLFLQSRRRKVMELVCQRYEKSRNLYQYRSTKGQIHTQTLGQNYLIDPKTKSVYCFVHKVASSSWMALYAKLYRDRDPEFVAEIEKTGSFRRL